MHTPCLPPFDAIVRKWSDLAERRQAYFIELYQSGRWTHYYTQRTFALRMRDVLANAKTWRELAGTVEPRDEAA